MEREIPLRDIRVDPKLPSRPEYRGVHDLARDVEEHGLLQALVVRPSRRAGKYDVVFGRRRWLAVRELGWESVRCYVRDDLEGDDEAAALAVLAEMWTRQEPGKMEAAWGLAAYQEASGASTRELARLSRLSPATVRRYCAVGRAVTPEALREAGVEVDEAVRMPIRALDVIARTEDADQRRDKLRAAAEARRERRSVLRAVAPELAPDAEPYSLHRTRAGGLSLTIREPAHRWPPEATESFVRRFAEEALPLVGSAWERSGIPVPGAPPATEAQPALEQDRRASFESGRQAGLQVGFSAGQETARREAERRIQSLQERVQELSRRLAEQAPAEQVRVEMTAKLRQEHARETSNLKLRYELAMAQLRQQHDQERQELVGGVVEMQREMAGFAQQRQKDAAQIRALQEELARAKGGGGLKGLFFGGK